MGGLAALGGVLTFVVATFVRGVPALVAQLSTSVNDRELAGHRPAAAQHRATLRVQAQLLATLSANHLAITSGALTRPQRGSDFLRMGAGLDLLDRP